MKECMWFLSCLLALASVAGRAGAQSNCGPILADASEKTLEQVSAQHFQCAVKSHLEKDGVPSSLKDLVILTPESIQNITYRDSILEWKVPAGPNYAPGKKAACEEDLKRFLNNALERVNWFNAETGKELRGKWNLVVSEEVVPPTTQPMQPTQPEAKVACVPRVYCVRAGLFGCRTRQVVCWVPATISNCEPSATPPSCTPSVCESFAEKVDANLRSVLTRNVSPEEPRWWHNDEGKRSYCRSVLVDVVEGVCIFRGENGVLMSCTAERLSAEDATYVRSWRKAPSGNEKQLAFRPFKDVSGNHEAALILVAVADQEASFVRRDGALIVVPLDQLSQADREYALQWKLPEWYAFAKSQLDALASLTSLVQDSDIR